MPTPTNFELAGDFMEAFGQEVQVHPTWPDFSTRELRLELIEKNMKNLKKLLKIVTSWKLPTLSQIYFMLSTVLGTHLVLTLMSAILKFTDLI